MIGDVLIVGFGNVLRSDDGLGWHAATRLADDPRLCGATVLRRHQLTPELAQDVSAARFVVFVDADRGPAGALSIRVVDPVRPEMGGGSLSHHVDAGALLALADELYGARPAAVSVSVGAGSMDIGEALTPAIEAIVPDVVDAVAILAAAGAQAVDRATRATRTTRA